MVLLSLDSSDRNGSIALARCGPGELCDVLGMVQLAGGTFSAQLVPQIRALLTQYGFSKERIDGFAVVSGPGSFTGLRIGLAAVKALAEVLEKPIAAVSLLHAVAQAGNAGGRVMAALDAGRTEVYAGEYEVGAATRRIQERLVTQAELIMIAAGQTVVTPDEKLADLAKAAGLDVEVIARPRSDTIARIGWMKILSGETVSPEMLDANYIRRMEGEILVKAGPLTS
jgi:tRNA threonylcarbamoyladenosine biosynthesis protein TsaB